MNFSTSEDLDFQRYCIATYGSIGNLIHKAKKGEIDAQVHLGCAYSEGFGDILPQDDDKAIGWLNTAVENGCESPDVLGKLGELLGQTGSLPCQRKAYELCLRAARLGYASSQINLAEMYHFGVEGVVSKDLKEAFKWLKKAADEDLSDESEVRTDLFGGVYANTLRKMQNAIGGEKQMALKLLFLNYDAGDCPEGRPQPSKAVYYLTKAAELGDTEAQVILGDIYLNGRCEQLRDVSRARRWLSKASDKGDTWAKKVIICSDFVSPFCSQHLPSLFIMIIIITIFGGRGGERRFLVALTQNHDTKPQPHVARIALSTNDVTNFWSLL